MDLRDFPWRTPVPDGWAAEVAALSAALKDPDAGPAGDPAAMAGDVRRLAGVRANGLQQIALNRLARRLWPHRALFPTFRPLRVALLSNRTVNFLAADIAGAGLARGLAVEVVEAEFDTVAAVASGAVALDAGGPLDAVVLLLDDAGLLAADIALGAEAEAAALAEAAARLDHLTEQLGKRLAAPVVVATLAARPQDFIASADPAIAGARTRLVRGVNDAIAQGAERGAWLMWDLAGLAAQVGLNAWFDPVRFHLSKAPFAVELSALAADHLCRVAAAMSGKAGRALVLDLDNTLWGGVIGDDGVDGIRIGQGSPEGEAFLAMQRMALVLRKRGAVLAVCSKNDEDVARRPFRDHPDMLLRLEHIAVFQANWSDKATNIQAVAQALNLGLESLVFVDDNPAERARVRQAFPQVCVPEVGDDPAWYPALIAASGAFESLTLNDEDLMRAKAYQAEAVRAELREQVGDYDDYLRSLKMRMIIAPFDAVGRARIAQLIAKSNQFNLTTRRYSIAEVEALEADPDVTAWQVRLSDAFADHGMIAVVIVRKGGAAWTIDSWLMSCRVLERGVEQTLMNAVVERAGAAGASELQGVFIATERNRIVADFYDRMGFEPMTRHVAGPGQAYRLEIAGFSPFASQIEVAS